MSRSIVNYERSYCIHCLKTLILLFISDNPCVTICSIWYIDFNGWPQATFEFKSALHELVDNCKTLHMSLTFEAMKADWCIKPSCIKMLPDVGMVKVYPNCVLKAANVDWVVTLSWYTYTSQFLDFFQLVLLCSYQWHLRHSPPSRHLCLFLWQTFLLPLFLYFLKSASCRTTFEHEPCTCKLALKVWSYKHKSKYDSFYDFPCARVSHVSRQISNGLNLNMFTPLEMHTRNERTMTNVDSANLSVTRCPYRVHYVVDNSAEHYQSAAKKLLDL